MITHDELTRMKATANAEIAMERPGMADTMAYQILMLVSEIERLETERNAWRDALQHLTPLGSEYTEPNECVDYVRKRMNTPQLVVDLRKQIEHLAELEVQLADANERIKTLEAQIPTTKYHDVEQYYKDET